MKPICIPCQRFFRSKKTGFYFIEGMPVVDGALPGNSEPDKWKPYKMWCGDQWECEGCGTQILSGFGFKPIAEHFEENFAKKVEDHDAKFQVNDC